MLELGDNFGEYLRKLRGKMTLREAASRAGVSHTYIRDLELGNKTDPSHDTLTKIARAYGVSYGDLSSKKFQTIDNPKWLRRFGPPDKTPLETMKYFDLYDEEGFVRAEFLEEISILIHRYMLTVPIKEKGDIRYEEFLNALEEKGENVIAEVRSELEDIIFESYRNQEDLINILKLDGTTYNGQQLSVDDRQRILDMLKLMFPDRQD
jgi:transcriptional regulator with XRE-family HTH domain